MLDKLSFSPGCVCSIGNLIIKDRFIRRWVHKEGFSGFKRYVTAAEDKELEAKIAVVEKYNIRIPELVERIERCHIEDLDFAGKESCCCLPFERRSRWSLEVSLHLWLPVAMLIKGKGTRPRC